ncbi:MAG: transposase [Mycobacteriaceae bacterium]
MGARATPVWANRRLLLRARERLSEQAFTRMWNDAVDNDLSGQLLAAWIAKEELRALLGCAARGGQRNDVAHRLTSFYDWCARTDIPEVITLAETVQQWWPELLAFLQTGLTNARTEARTDSSSKSCVARPASGTRTTTGCVYVALRSTTRRGKGRARSKLKSLHVEDDCVGIMGGTPPPNWWSCCWHTAPTRMLPAQTGGHRTSSDLSNPPGLGKLKRRSDLGVEPPMRARGPTRRVVVASAQLRREGCK